MKPVPFSTQSLHFDQNFRLPTCLFLLKIPNIVFKRKENIKSPQRVLLIYYELELECIYLTSILDS